MKNNNKSIGNKGEKIAQGYLLSLKYNIIETNYYTRVGEIDIIAKKDNTLYFFEVKTRTNNTFGKGYESISILKISKIRKVAEQYIVNIGWKGFVKILAISIDYRSYDSYDIDVMEIF